MCREEGNVSKHPPLVGYKIITFAPKIQVFSEKKSPQNGDRSVLLAERTNLPGIFLTKCRRTGPAHLCYNKPSAICVGFPDLPRAQRVVAPSRSFVPWAALISCWPLPQQLLSVSAAGRGRRRCPMGELSPKGMERVRQRKKKACLYNRRRVC